MVAIWLPYCRNYKVEPLLPAAYFKSASRHSNTEHDKDYVIVKNLFEEMKNRVENVTKIGRVPEELSVENKGFAEWDAFTSPRDHGAIIQILLDNNKDVEGQSLPKLVYLAREKRPNHFHNFKAGAMNALIDFHGLDGMGGPLYVGTGCFHRREILSGKSLYDGKRIDWNMVNDHKETTSENYTNEELKKLATCTFETDTEWGKEGCLFTAEDGNQYFTILNERPFLGFAATTLDQILAQHKRCSEGDLLILLSKYSPALYGLGKIHLGQLMGYMIYCLWSPSSVPTLYYSIVPSLCLLKGVSLFPTVSSGWFLPFAYIIVFISAFDFLEYLQSAGSTRGWWNDRSIWLHKRTTSYLFALLDTILGSNLSFVISSKVADNDVQERYDKELMEFGVSSPLFLIDGRECFSHKAEYGATVRFSFVVISSQDTDDWHYTVYGTDLLVKGPNGELIQEFHDKISESSEFVAHNEGLYRFCFSNHSPYPEFVDVNVHSSLFYNHVEHAKHDHFIPIMDQIAKLGDKLVDIQFKQHWLMAEADRHEIINKRMSKRAMHKALVESFAMIGASMLQVKGPNGELIQEFRDKTSENSEFVAHNEGLYQFCFSNQSPYQETLDFDVHSSHFYRDVEHAKDDHLKPVMEQIKILEEALWRIQFEQSWLESKADRHAIINEKISKRAVHKALVESFAMVGASVLQVYLLTHLFKRKLGMSSV
ncbi:cellulose synthase-like protein E1 isoform X2 [Tanacetum coccineum]